MARRAGRAARSPCTMWFWSPASPHDMPSDRVLRVCGGPANDAGLPGDDSDRLAYQPHAHLVHRRRHGEGCGERPDDPADPPVDDEGVCYPAEQGRAPLVRGLRGRAQAAQHAAGVRGVLRLRRCDNRVLEAAAHAHRPCGQVREPSGGERPEAGEARQAGQQDRAHDIPR